MSDVQVCVLITGILDTHATGVCERGYVNIYIISQALLILLIQPQ